MKFVAKVVVEDLNKIKDLVANIEKSIGSTKTLEKGMTKVNDAAKVVAKTVEKISDKTKLAADSFNSLIRGTMIDRVKSFTNKLGEMNQHWKNVGGLKGFNKQLTSTLKGGLKNITGFTKNLSGMMKGLATGGIKSLITGLTGVIPAASAALAALAPFVLVIGGIVAAVLVLKRMWKLNIGGMQTSFYRIVGKMKDIWARFVIAFDKSLRSLSPLFKIIFNNLENKILPVLYAVEGLLAGITAGVQPIITAFEEALKPISEIFAEFGFANLHMRKFELIGKIFESIGKVIGFVLKVSLYPALKLFEKISESIVKLKSVWDIFASALSGLKLPKWLQTVVDFMGGSKSSNVENREKENRQAIRRQAGSMLSQSSQNITNNNQNLSINTSAQITPESANNFFGAAASNLNMNMRGAGS